jgi:hypothetical protein
MPAPDVPGGYGLSRITSMSITTRKSIVAIRIYKRFLLLQRQVDYKRTEQLAWGKTCLQGLLGNTVRKNVKRMALEPGENIRSMQYFISQSPWKAEPVKQVTKAIDNGHCNGIH